MAWYDDLYGAYDSVNNFLDDPMAKLKDEEEKKKQAIQEQQVAALTGTQPSTPDQTKPAVPSTYEQIVAQRESGGNPNIGYHNPQKSSAYGTYGITGPAYADVQKANPAFQGRDITTLSPDEQKQAMETYTGLNKKRLEGLGIPGTEGNLNAAHILGPGGLSQYMKDKSFSPQAMAANGGYGPLSQVVEKALKYGVPSAQAAGPAVPTTNNPASTTATDQSAQNKQGLNFGGVVPAPTSTTGTATPFTQASTNLPQDTQAIINSALKTAADTDYIDKITAGQMDKKQLNELAFDKNAPSWARQYSAERLMNNIQYETGSIKAQEVGAAAKAGSPEAINTIQTELGNANKRNRQEGSHILAWIYNELGLTALSNEEQRKLGAGQQDLSVTLANGKKAVATFDALGQVTKGFTSDGKQLTEEQMAEIQLKGKPTPVTTGAEFFIDKKGNKYRSQADALGGMATVDMVTGRPYTGPSSELTRLRDDTAFKKMDQELVNSLLKKQYASKVDFLLDAKRLGATDDQIPELGQQFDQINQVSGGPGAKPTVQSAPGATTTASATPTVPSSPTVPSATTTTTATTSTPTKPVAPFNMNAAKNAQEGEQKISTINQQRAFNAETIHSTLLDSGIVKLVEDSTGSYIGGKADDIAAAFGKGTEGAKNIAKLDVISSNLLANMPPPKGDQSNFEIQQRQKAIANLADRNAPVSTRIAALQSLIDINKRYAPDKDWTFGGKGPQKENTELDRIKAEQERRKKEKEKK